MGCGAVKHSQVVKVQGPTDDHGTSILHAADRGSCHSVRASGMMTLANSLSSLSSSLSSVFFESEMMFGGTSSSKAKQRPDMLLFSGITSAEDVFVDVHGVCLLGTSSPHRVSGLTDSGIDFDSKGSKSSTHFSGVKKVPVLKEHNGSNAVIEPEFSEKVIAHHGADDRSALRQLLTRDGMAFSCRKGKKADAPNQDSILLWSTGTVTCIGVADGHGADGHWASHWAVHYALSLAIKELSSQLEVLPDESGLNRIFNLTHEALRLRAADSCFDLRDSGTTLTICFIDNVRQTILTAWVGDSRCIISRQEGREPESLSVDHKPSDLEERKRIVASGGSILQFKGGSRVASNHAGTGTMLAVSRAVGDLSLHDVGVSHRPGFKGSKFGDFADEFILCCSDGVWEFMSHVEVTSIIRKAGRANVQEGVDELVREARERWLKAEQDLMTDDISAIAVWL